MIKLRVAEGRIVREAKRFAGKKASKKEIKRQSDIKGAVEITSENYDDINFSNFKQVMYNWDETNGHYNACLFQDTKTGEYYSCIGSGNCQILPLSSHS